MRQLQLVAHGEPSDVIELHTVKYCNSPNFCSSAETEETLKYGPLSCSLRQPPVPR